MQSQTNTTRTLEIDGMAGDACVQKVTSALEGVLGVSTQSVKVGAATIEADRTGCDAACAAIGSAGYKARESTRTVEASSWTVKTPSEHKSGSQSYAPTQAPAIANAGVAEPVGAAS